MSDLPSVPTSKDELLIAALRNADRVSGLLNEIYAEWTRLAGDSVDDPKWERLHQLTLRRFTDCSALHLFIAAHSLAIPLPEDLIYESCSEAAE